MKRLKMYFKAAPATMIVMLICLAVFLLIQLKPFVSSNSGMAVLMGAYYKPFLLAGEFWRLLTVGFVHIDFWHLLMNMYSLFNLGLLLERRYGTRFYLILLLISIIGGSLFMTAATDTMLAVGISGGLYGLTAAMLVLFYHLGLFANPAFRASVTRMVLINLLINFMPGVGVMAHVGGFITGLLIAMALEDWRSGGALKLNSWLACGLLLISLGVIGTIRPQLSDERYYSFDLSLLAYEQAHGLGNYAKALGYRLDKVYHVDMLGVMVELLEEE